MAVDRSVMRLDHVTRTRRRKRSKEKSFTFQSHFPILDGEVRVFIFCLFYQRLWVMLSLLVSD